MDDIDEAGASPVTLISGSRKGIGRGLAEHYCAAGHRVIGCSRTSPEWTLRGYDHVCLDVNDEHAVVELFAHVRSAYGRLDNLINNAGISGMNHCLLTTAAQTRRILETNVVGTFLFCREAARIMQTRGFGRIVNFASVALPLKLEGEAVYAASKGAVVALTQILARELAPFGITVNSVGPSPVETDMISGVPKEKMDRLLRRQAIPAYATVDDIANVIDFYLRPESGQVTGQILYLGGV